MIKDNYFLQYFKTHLRTYNKYKVTLLALLALLNYFYINYNYIINLIKEKKD